jgi:hypothetical protein
VVFGVLTDNLEQAIEGRGQSRQQGAEAAEAVEIANLLVQLR